MLKSALFHNVDINPIHVHVTQINSAFFGSLRKWLSLDDKPSQIKRYSIPAQTRERVTYLSVSYMLYNRHVLNFGHRLLLNFDAGVSSKEEEKISEGRNETLAGLSAWLSTCVGQLLCLLCLLACLRVEQFGNSLNTYIRGLQKLLCAVAKAVAVLSCHCCKLLAVVEEGIPGPAFIPACSVCYLAQLVKR